MIALAAVIAAVALLALAIFGDGSSYQVKGIFQNAGQLVNGNQVRVGGKPVGTISDIELNDRAQAVVTMNLDDEFSPLHEGTSATIRATSLSGIANRYISLNPGPNSAEDIPDGGVIDADDTTAPVDIDVLFNTLDAETREGLRNVIRGSGTQYAGRGQDANESIKYFAPFLSSTTALTRELALDQEVLERFITDGAATVSAIAERSDDLEQLVSNTSTAMGAIADENVALQRTLELLPDTLRKANTTFVNLRATLDDLALLVEVSKPATKELAPFLRDLRPVVAEARPTVADLRDLISSPGPNNDLIDLTSQQPRLAQLTAIGVPARDPHTGSRPAGGRVRPRLHARPRRLAHEVRRGGGPSTTRTAITPACSRCSVPRTSRPGPPGRPGPSPPCRSQTASTVSRRA